MRARAIADIAFRSLDDTAEDARVATLDRYRTLSATDKAGLSRVSQEAAHSLGATQAAISFVDRSRVWFGGAFGFDRSDVPRADSFCDAVVRSGEPLMVRDGLVDPRFLEHEMVCAEPGLRSYAGAPLVDHSSHTLGTVAVYSVAPDAFAHGVLDDLGALATLVRDFLAVAGDRNPPAPRVRRVQGWLGVKAVEVKAGGSGEAGLLVVGVARRSPAEEAGLRPTDVLHSIGGQVLVTVSDVAAAMARQVAGGSTSIRFRRAGHWRSCEIEIRPRRPTFRVGRAPG